MIEYFFQLQDFLFNIYFSLISNHTMSSIRFITLSIFMLLTLCCNNAAAQNLTTIKSIQGFNAHSPMVGKNVTVKGIVTANFQEEKSFSGFFIQSQSVTKKTKGSSGIFVYESRKKVAVGDLIRLSGEVSEHNDVTQISKIKFVEILKTKQKLPKAIPLDLPLNGFNLENLEGMRVTLKKPAIISDHYNYIKYGEIVVSSQLLMTPTNSVKPGKQAKLKKQQNESDRLLIDDGNFNQFPNYRKINTQTPINIGAKIQVEGIMHYAFDHYRIEPTKSIEFFDSAYKKQSKPTEIKGKVKIASFNVKNYFTTLDNGKAICGPKVNFDCRGADSYKEFKRQQDKLVHAINTADADVFALQELENNRRSLKSLVIALNKDKQNKTWHYIKTGSLGEDVIRVGLIYQKEKITPIGKFKVLNPKVMADFEADKNRDVLLQTFKDLENNTFNIAVLHLKSKRCSDAIDEDLDQGDGQGCYNASRVKVAQQISDWLKQDPTNQEAQPTIVLGDFNSYTKEDPITFLGENGFINLANNFLTATHWTSVFRGEVGSIDHVLTNKTAHKAAQGLTQWHINTLVPGWFDYNLENLFKSKTKPKSYYNTGPFASSDHDMIIAGFTF